MSCLIIFTVFLKLNKCLLGDGYSFCFSVSLLYWFVTMCMICTARCILLPALKCSQIDVVCCDGNKKIFFQIHFLFILTQERG